MDGHDHDLDLEDGFAQVAVALFAPESIDATLQRIVEVAEIVIEGCDAAGIFVVEDGRVVTAAATGPLVTRLHALQVESGEGPCLDAAGEETTFYAADVADDDRWPTFGPLAVEAGVRSILASSLSPDRSSVLNLYARRPGAFGATDRAQGVLFATLARLALDSAEERAADERRTGEFRDGLRSRALIGQAQGILMEREHITADQAFDVLRRASQRMNVKLRIVAQTLVETDTEPAREDIGDPTDPV
ncbi:ANTAR domain-containing protein [Aquihabitans daechungensis]|uniref:ANTAR domain-containing protein n=1 Tax=Aquihabitans daechungensis TaxID=1052257 RepID=UPI003BA1C2A1